MLPDMFNTGFGSSASKMIEDRSSAREPKVTKKCEDNRRLGKQIIVDKMENLDTFLSRAFSNIFVWGNMSDSVQVSLNIQCFVV